MLRKCKYFLLSFVFFISSLLPCISVYAQGTSWTAEEKIRYVGNAFYKIFTDISGVLVPSGLNGSDLQRDFQAYVLNSDVIQDNMTYDEWIASEIGITYQNGDSGIADITYSPTFQNTINNFAHEWVDENVGYIFAYSYAVNAYQGLYSSQEDYNNFVSFVREHEDHILLFNSIMQNKGVYTIYELDNEDIEIVKYSSIDSNTRIKVNFYKDWTLIYRGAFYLWTYNFTNKTWTRSDTKYDVSNQAILSMFENPTYSASPNGHVINSQSVQYQVYKSVDYMRQATQGVQPYYVTDSFNSNWQDNSITDSYNTTTTAVNNTVSYEDVSNYVNNYYVENNSYPTTNTVYNYINNY